ncbi:MAG TPA: hypothetical protein VN636_06775 [Acidimicrobiia bacterium]|nr:hypothetical protein [Acidimicrobiia bacterium]
MRDIHTWNLLALHTPNFLPKTVFGFHTPYLRRAGRLIWAMLLFTIGLVGAFLVIRRPKKSNEPPTWAQCVLGALFVWVMFALGYGVIPHEWLTFGNAYLNFDSSSFLLHKNTVIPFDITRDKFVDAVAAGIYVVMLGLNVYFFTAWQKRKVAEPAAEVEAAPSEPTTGGGMFSRLRRREKRVSAFGRPVTTTET